RASEPLRLLRLAKRGELRPGAPRPATGIARGRLCLGSGKPVDEEDARSTHADDARLQKARHASRAYRAPYRPSVRLSVPASQRRAAGNARPRVPGSPESDLRQWLLLALPRMQADAAPGVKSRLLGAK